MDEKEAEKRGLEPMGLFKGFAVAGCEPDEMGIGPVFAVPRLLERQGLKIDDIDLWELNEAFASQCLYSRDRLGIDPAASFDLSTFADLGHELLGSTALGTTLGIVLALYLRYGGRNLLLVLVALGLPMTALLEYVHLDPLLSFMVAGFVVQNFSRGGDKLLHALERTGAIVFVVFFATAGAHLDSSVG